MIDDKTKKALEDFAKEQSVDENTSNKLLEMQYLFQECLSHEFKNAFTEEGSGAMGRKRDFSFWINDESYSVMISRTPDYDLKSEIKVDNDIPIPDEDMPSGSIH